MIYLKDAPSGTNVSHAIIERDLRSGRERVIRHSGHRSSLSKMLSMRSLNPILSHDGSRLAYLENADGKALLLIISRADGATRAVWELDRGEAPVLDWLPDNRRVLLSVEDEQGTQQLHLVDTETKSARLFGQPLRGEDRIHQLSVHPEGNRVAFGRGGVLQRIWTMKNILSEKTRSAN